MQTKGKALVQHFGLCLIWNIYSKQGVFVSKALTHSCDTLANIHCSSLTGTAVPAILYPLCLTVPSILRLTRSGTYNSSI